MTALFLLSCLPAPLPQADPPPSPPAAELPLAFGDAGPGAVVVWTRAPTPGTVTVRATWDGGGTSVAPLEVELDGTGRIVLTGLPEDRVVTVVAEGPGARGVGVVRTPATSQLTEPGRTVTLAVVGDLGGQGYCRPQDGWPMLRVLAASRPDVVVANGDLVYADNGCRETDPTGVPVVPLGVPGVAEPSVDWNDRAGLRALFDAQWAYRHDDPALRAVRASTLWVAQWDDHEVVNDFGAAWDAWYTGDEARAGYPNLVAEGKAAFLRWNPLPDGRVWRQLRVHPALELFVVDARSFRSRNDAPDGPDKTLLGAEQRAWLERALVESTAQWKVVSVNVPISVPTGSRAWREGRDGWANGTGDPEVPEGSEDLSVRTGFERELQGLLGALDRANVRNLLFVTTDVHHSRLIRYGVDLDGDKEPLVFHEAVGGPLAAYMVPPGELDPTFRPQSLYAEGGVTTFTRLELVPDSRGGVLRVATIGPDGVRPGSELELAPEP